MIDKDKWQLKSTCHNYNKKGHIRPNWPDLVDDYDKNLIPDVDSDKENKKKSSLKKRKRKIVFAQDEESENDNDDYNGEKA